MPADRTLEATHAYYERGEERERLAAGIGELEFERTKEIVLRHLPPAPAVVVDIGGGPGRYTLWLAGLGYRVLHRDLMPLHVRQLRAAAAAESGINSAVADARELDLDDQCADAALLLGPLYHLDRRPDRLRALAEARRVVRRGGPVFAAAITRWAPRLNGILRQRLYQRLPHIEAEIPALERTGRIPPVHPGAFCGYAHRPGQLRSELTAGGFRVVDLVSVEGPASMLDDLAARMSDPRDRQVVVETARAMERVPELLGVGPHLLATAR